MRSDPTLARLFLWITLILYNTDAQLEGLGTTHIKCVGAQLPSFWLSMGLLGVIERSISRPKTVVALEGLT